MGNSLPDRLLYLAPVADYLNTLPLEEVHEDTDLSVLETSIHRRVELLSDEEARTELVRDAELLQKWLASPENRDSRLNLILPILPEALDVFDSESMDDRPDRGEVRLGLPEGAKVTEEAGCLDLEYQSMCLNLMPRCPEEFEMEDEYLREHAKKFPMVDGDGMTLGKVEFGPVKGTKYISIIKADRSKRVEYLLSVPGGYVRAFLQSVSDKYDETGLESYFQTIEVLHAETKE